MMIWGQISEGEVIIFRRVSKREAREEAIGRNEDGDDSVDYSFGLYIKLYMQHMSTHAETTHNK